MTKTQAKVGGGERTRYRMKDLCSLTGLSRQAIHFYIQQGLVPEGEKTGRNMAYYGPEHLERLQTIRRLQEEHFLPLKAIKAILDNQDEGFTEPQKQLFRELKPHMQRVLPWRRPHPQWRELGEVAESLGVEEKDLARLVELGTLAVTEQDGRTLISEEDTAFLELYAQLRHVGFVEELGFQPDDLQIYEEAFSLLFRKEKELVARRLVKVPPEQVVPMLEKALPIIHAFFVRYHTQQIRNFFAGI